MAQLQEFTGLPAMMSAHACIGYFGGGFCFLVGAATARYLCQSWKVYIHVALCLLGFTSILVAYILTEVWHQGFIIMQDRHGFNGFTLVVLSFIQVVGGLIRPRKESKLRNKWLWFHRLLAILIIASFIFQVFTGFRRLHRMFHIHAHTSEVLFECFVAVYFSLVAVSEIGLYFRTCCSIPIQSLRRLFRVFKTHVYPRVVFIFSVLCFAFCIAYWTLFSTANSFAPWTNPPMPMPPMHMPMAFFIYEPNGFPLFFSKLIVNSAGRTVCAAVLVFLLSASTSLSMIKLGKLEMKWVQTSQKWFWRVIGSLSHAFRQSLHYLSMLAVMTYSVVLFFAVLLGHAFGFFIAATLSEEVGYEHTQKHENIAWTVPLNSAGDFQISYPSEAKHCLCDPMTCTCEPKSCNKQGGCSCER
ncbi:hypothetical protein GpartN1_g6016.t1 [Galdieria partita]|uniref:Copper transport protein n=1 Tax=Galdieria partita TaxID=83374 RepID=A0A9C7Q1C2_9RHOD|nr:hypothetical protein GpartN1_g6016.t1 [Galdieria partita]